MSDIFSRLTQLIEFENINLSAFAKKIGSKSQTVRNIIVEKRNNPGFELIVAILTSFEYVNAEWLLLGRGEMKKQKEEFMADKDKIIALQAKVIENLEEEINRYKKAPINVENVPTAKIRK